MNKEKLMPRLRFDDFINKDEWIEDSLGNMSQSYSGGTPSVGNRDFYNGSIPFIRSGEIHKNSTKLFITEEALNNSSARMVHKGDILYALYGATSGEVNISKIDGAINQAILAIIPDQKYDTNFLEKYLNKNKEYILNSFLQGGQGNLSGEIIRALNIIHPTIQEQQKIGSFFKKIDEMIQLQQSKVNKVKDIKSAYLSELFPKEGEKYPKKRFEGFTKAWEFKNLETLTTTFTDGDWIESKDQSESGVRLIQTGNIGVTQFLDKPNNRKWISESTFKKLNCEEIFPGDILISRLPEPAGRATIVPKLNTRMITAVDCTIVRPSSEYSSDFLIQYLCTSNYFNKITAELAGGTRQRISRSNLAEIKVPVPKTLEEQEKIGQFFKNLDNQISTEEEKLVKLEKLKQAYLNDMFV